VVAKFLASLLFCILMPLVVPGPIAEEHLEIHRSLERLARGSGVVGRSARALRDVLDPHFRKENELVMPLIGVFRDLAEGKRPEDAERALQLAERFAAEYELMLREHAEILRTLEGLERAAKRSGSRAAKAFASRLRRHAKIEELLIYPAAAACLRLLRQT